MRSWTTVRAADFIEFNPRLSIKKGTLATKVSMDKLQPFTKKIPSTEQAEFAGGSKFCNGDTIMARITPCLENGKTAFVDILADGEVAFGSTEFIVMRAKKGVSDPQFVYYLATSPAFRSVAIKSMVGSSGRQRVQQGVLDELELLVPPLDEQRGIGAFLAAIDQKIAINNTINDNLYTQARAITNRWIAENKDDYDLLSLSDVAEINPDTYSPKEEWEYVNYLDTSSITDGCIADIQRIIPASEKLPSRARRIIAPNDVVFSTVRPNQRHFGIISEPLPNMLASTGFAVIRSKNPLVCNELIYLCLTESAFIEKMQQLAEQSTSTFPSIKPSDLGVCEIPCPKDGLSSNLTETLRVIFALVAANHRENASLAEMRDSLLPKLMTGEIDVSDTRL